MIRRLSPQVIPLAKTRIGSRRDLAVYRHDDQGFTFLELVIIVAIMGLLVSVTMLSLPKWRANMNLKTTARNVVYSFQFAKLEAAKRSASMLVQVTAGGSGAGGCIVFIDNGQGGGTAGDSIPNGGEILRDLALPARVTISSTTISPYAFNNRGFPTSGGGTMVLTNGEKTYNVVLSPVGGLSLNGPI